jgi:hypothetical protein
MAINAYCSRCGKGLDIISQWWRSDSKGSGYLCHQKKPCDPKRVAKFRKEKRKP